MIKALLWNEWRQKRSNILLLFGVVVTLWIAVWLAKWLMPKLINVDVAEDIMFVIMMITLFGSVIICAIGILAVEQEKKLFPFVLGLPITPSRIFWSKLGFDLVVLIISLILNAIFILAWAYGLELEKRDSFAKGIIIASGCLIPFYWAMFGGAMGRRCGNYFIAVLSNFVVMIFGMAIIIATIILLQANNCPVIISTSVAFVTAGLTISLLLLFWGYFSWIFIVARGLQGTKSTLAISCWLLIVSGVLFAASYAYPWGSWWQARNEAVKLNLIAATHGRPIPETENAAESLRQFYRIWDTFYQKISQSERDSLRCDLWNIPLNAVQRKVMDMLNSSSGNQALEYLDLALQKTYCRITPTLQNNMNDGSDEFINARNFLSFQAINLRLKGDDAAFFAVVKKMSRLYEMRWEMSADFWAVYSFIAACRTAVYRGPDTPESVCFYREMMKAIDHVRLFSCSPKVDMSLFFPRWLSRGIVPFVMDEAQTMKNDIAEMRLIGKSDGCLPSIRSEAQTLAAKRGEKSVENLNLYRYFRQKNEITSYNLALALKIYRIENGVFPEKLTQLVPGILPELPRNALTGKYFDYQRKDNGFIITGKNELNNNVVTIDYQPWPGKTTETKP